MGPEAKGILWWLRRWCLGPTTPTFFCRTLALRTAGFSLDCTRARLTHPHPSLPCCTQAELIKYCLEHNIKVISCMGAGAKADVSSIRYYDLEEAEGCSLAVSLRKHLRKAGLINAKVRVLVCLGRSMCLLVSLCSL